MKKILRLGKKVGEVCSHACENPVSRGKGEFILDVASASGLDTKMINRVTSEVSFQDGLHIVPHRSVQWPHRTRAFFSKDWQQHFLGVHPSEHGKFAVEALSREEGRIVIVMLAHQHAFYESGTPTDAEREAFHEGIISSDLAGQREFFWGEVLCRFQAASNKNWLVVAYNRGADIPLQEKEELLKLFAHEKPPEPND